MAYCGSRYMESRTARPSIQKLTAIPSPGETIVTAVANNILQRSHRLLLATASPLQHALLSPASATLRFTEHRGRFELHAKLRILRPSMLRHIRASNCLFGLTIADWGNSLRSHWSPYDTRFRKGSNQRLPYNPTSHHEVSEFVIGHMFDTLAGFAWICPS
jgi:hypothetical protein